MYSNNFVVGINIISISFLTVTLQSEPQSSKADKQLLQNHPNVLRGRTQDVNGEFTLAEFVSRADLSGASKRIRREERLQSVSNETDNESNFLQDEIGWSNINQEVDMVIPLVLTHLQTLGVEYLHLPEMKESISVRPLLVAYEVGLHLTNGIVYNIAGVQRYGDAFMTYAEKAFVCKFHLVIANLQFEYNFVLKLMALEGYGKVIGSLENTIIYAELVINISDIRMQLNDFRIVEFSHINVQLDQQRIIRQLTGAILTPVTNLFRDRITTSISDGLKDQMQLLMAHFDNQDPLELKKFASKLLSGLTGPSLVV